jgi:5-methylcytosine-specific restriction endonuclease McrA
MRCANGTHVIYRKENNQLTWPDELVKAYKGFTGGQWSAGTQTRRRTRSVSPVIRTVMDRDGCECFYCGLILDGSTATLEHFVALAHGGPNHISNYVLACKKHNLEAGHLSAAEKVKMRDRIRESGKIRLFISTLRLKPA